jgi:hypothetical protein
LAVTAPDRLRCARVTHQNVAAQLRHFLKLTFILLCNRTSGSQMPLETMPNVEKRLLLDYGDEFSRGRYERSAGNDLDTLVTNKSKQGVGS